MEDFGLNAWPRGGLSDAVDALVGEYLAEQEVPTLLPGSVGLYLGDFYRSVSYPFTACIAA